MENTVVLNANHQQPEIIEMVSDETGCSAESISAVKLQKVYRSYRTRRRLADSAVIAEEFWWQAIDYARLNHSTVSFFSYNKPETAASRWTRIRLNASKVGKGLCKDDKAQKLAFQHWIEAIDPRHRYGHNLHLYYEEWCKEDVSQPFFYWLDIGKGKDIDLQDCPRSRLRQECIKYLGPRECYEYTVAEGLVVHKLTGKLLETNEGLEISKWIFVMSTCKKLYAGEKKKGSFHHSSFLAGATTLIAGSLAVEGGKLKSVSAYSGHYRPTNQNLSSFLVFLKQNGVNIDEVQVLSPTQNCKTHDSNVTCQIESNCEQSTNHRPDKVESSNGDGSHQHSESSVSSITANAGRYRRSVSNIQDSRTNVTKKEIMRRIESKKEACSYQLGNQLCLKWTTGAGPRIGCVADYPLKLRQEALKFVNISPMDASPDSAFSGGLTSLSTLCVVM